MRTLVVGFVVIFAALVLAALPILFTGKTLLYTAAAGHPVISPRATTIGAALAAGFALASLAWAAATVLWRQMVYGVGP